MQSPHMGEKGTSILAALVVTAMLGGGLAANFAVQPESQLAQASKSAAQRAVEKAKRDKELKGEADQKCKDLIAEMESDKDLKKGDSKVAGDVEDDFLIGTPGNTKFKENTVSSRCVSAFVVGKKEDKNVVKCFGAVYNIVLHKEVGDKKKREPDKQSWRVRVKPSQALDQGNCAKVVTDDKGKPLSKEALQAALGKDPEVQKQVIEAIKETPKTALPAAQQDAFNAAVKELTDPDKANKAAGSAEKAWNKAYQEWQDCLSKGTSDCSKLGEKNLAAEQAYNEKKAIADYVVANKDYFNDAKRTLEGTARLGRSKEGGDNEDREVVTCVGTKCTYPDGRPAPIPGTVPPPGPGTPGYPGGNPGQSTGFGPNSGGGMGSLGQMLKGLFGTNQPPAGNRQPQAPGTCSGGQTICGGNTLYSRDNTCVDTAVQYCQYGCNGNQCAQPPQQGQQCSPPPPQPDPSGCQSGTWRPIYGPPPANFNAGYSQANPYSTTGNICVTGWQCIPGAGGGGTQGTNPPTAQISCQPQVGDVGMSLAITFSCSAGVSTGTGFNTGGAQSGATTTALSLPAGGGNTTNYGLTCSSNGQTGSAQCTVQVGKPAIVFVANPKSVSSGQTSAIGWVTSGMQACVISSANLPAFTSDNAGKTNVNGTVQTPPLTSSGTTYNFLLHCTTIGGATRDATTTVTVAQ